MDIIATHTDLRPEIQSQHPGGLLYVCTLGVIGDGAVYHGPAFMGTYAIASGGDKVSEETARRLFQSELEGRKYRR